jgi:crotonobetainyl-CoA:carnitine CoA-transferase CaiB-like acyl-CoA transferase
MPVSNGQTTVPAALDGIRVLDLSRVLAGPLCTQMLADLGAEVWKIESPSGDDTRHWGPPFRDGESAYFLSVNRGKKSVAVDLKDARGADLVRRLAARADVLVENFKHGDLQRFGLDYASLAAENPALVYASITGFGHTGPRAGQPGYDVVTEALTGIMSVTGEADGPPCKVGVAWVDVMTGLQATIGILAALRARAQHGRGQHIDLGMHEVGLMAMVNQAQAYLMTGTPPHRFGNAHPQIVPYQTFEAADGWLMVAVGNDGQFRRLANAIGHAPLGDDPRFRTNADRVRAREELVPQLAAVFRQRTRAEWTARLDPAGVPAAAVQDLAEAFADPQTTARGALWSLEHETLGAIRQVANPLQHMSLTPARAGAAPPPLGTHTDAVLGSELGLDAAMLAALRSSGAIGGR